MQAIKQALHSGVSLPHVLYLVDLSLHCLRRFDTAGCQQLLVKRSLQAPLLAKRINLDPISFCSVYGEPQLAA